MACKTWCTTGGQTALLSAKHEELKCIYRGVDVVIATNNEEQRVLLNLVVSHRWRKHTKLFILHRFGGV